LHSKQRNDEDEAVQIFHSASINQKAYATTLWLPGIGDIIDETACACAVSNVTRGENQYLLALGPAVNLEAGD
jgi:hypothetical protein